MPFDFRRIDIDAFSMSLRAWFVLGFVLVVAAAPGLLSLPVLDRDEARYAQATTQMLETDDYIQIKFQDQARNKKPIATYWLQASTTALLSGEDQRSIWTYRLPSLIAGVLATLAVFACGRVLLPNRDAFIGALLFGTTILVTTEAHIAKTDSLLLLSVVLMMTGLAKAYTSSGQSQKWSLLFWLSMGAGILIKGPIAPMIGGLTLVSLLLYHRGQHSALRALINLKHMILMLGVVLPWFIAIQIATSGEFLAEALGKELSDKIGGSSEGHGGPPGYHLAFLITHFFPATILVVPSVLIAGRRLWMARCTHSTCDQKKWQVFLFAWLVPSWFVFEILPTKLSHYTLPLYPALALIVGASAIELVGRTDMKASKRLGAVLFGLGGIILLTFSSPWAASAVIQATANEFQSIDAKTVLEAWQLPSRTNFIFWMFSLGALLVSIWFFIRRKSGLTIVSTVLVSIFLGIHIRAIFLPGQVWLDPTGRALDAIAALEMCGEVNYERAPSGQSPTIRSFGYAEPSLVFRTQTETMLPPRSEEKWIDGLIRGDIFVFNLEDLAARKKRNALSSLSERSDMTLIESPAFQALNYTEGDPVNFIAVKSCNAD